MGGATLATCARPGACVAVAVTVTVGCGMGASNTCPLVALTVAALTRKFPRWQQAKPPRPPVGP